LIVKGPVYACVAIAGGVVVSEMFTCLCLITLYTKDKKRTKGCGRMGGILSGMFKITTPDLLGNTFRSILSTTENLLIPEGFKRSGATGDSALFVYGAINAMAMPVIFFPSAALNALSGLLVPELAECRAQNKTNNISYIIKRVLRLSIIFSMAVAGVIFAFSAEISEVLYQNQTAAPYLKILAPVIPIMYLDMVVDGMLKGLNLQFHSMCYNIIDGAARVLLVFYLIPAYSVWGYIFVLYFSEILNFLLSFGKLASLSYLKIHIFKGALSPFLSIIISVFVMRLMPASVPLGIKTALGLLMYVVLLVITKSLKREDIRWFKSVIR
jgi:stage V sporulation protein B